MKKTKTKKPAKTLSPWDRVLISRHSNRPYVQDYIDSLFQDFLEIHGDRRFGDDASIMAGTALWKPNKDSETRIPVAIIGHQKGRKTKDKLERNFGMARPEGYRKALRLYDLASRFQLPLFLFIDTPGAYPGLDAEERGQSQAIAESIQALFRVKAPAVAVVIGEGGSGGALALGVADRVLMLEHSIYSVISPESCASILWNDAGLAKNASEKLKMSAPDLLRFGVIDKIIPEPTEGAHTDWEKTFFSVNESLQETYRDLSRKYSKFSEKSLTKLLNDRHLRFRKIGQATLHKGKGDL